jgi:polysaccharide pyruvyl transferase WcaK-like protein
VQHGHAVVAHMRNSERAEIIRRRYSPRQILDLMGRFDLAVGMRLHFLIFAALRGTPFAALPYASKVSRTWGWEVLHRGASGSGS